jgi:hypothetical protein
MIKPIDPRPVIVLSAITGLLIVGLVVSCTEQKYKPVVEPPKELSKTTENYYQRVSEFTYEGCEYIKVGFGKNVWGSHKGNCKNPIHNQQ